MKKLIALVLALVCVLGLVACSNNPNDDQSTKEEQNNLIPSMPEIEYTPYGDNKCPQLHATDLEYVIDIVNSEIEAQFQRLVVMAGEDGGIQTFTTTSDRFVSILLKADNPVSYGTDGKVWGICYDYYSETIVPCGAYLDQMGYSYTEAYGKIETLLGQKGFYEYIDIPCYYFNSNSDPVFVVVAIEHEAGADAWERVYCYDLGSNAFVAPLWDSSGTVVEPHDQFCYSADGTQTYELSADDEQYIIDLLNNASWINDLSNCDSDFVFYTQKQDIRYHSECGTFNDYTSQKSTTVSEEQRATINAMLGIN